MDSQLQIAYFESMISKLKEAEEIETDLNKLVEIGHLLDDAEHELINLRLEHERSIRA